MSILTPMVQALTRRAAVVDSPEALTALRGALSSAGLLVTPDVALRNMSVLACIRIVSQSLASVPLVLYQRDGRQRRRASDHAVFPVLAQIGNGEMTAYEVREARIAHCMAWGNGYAEIQYDGNYQVSGLWPLAPDRVGVERAENGRLQYTYWSDRAGQGYVLPGYRVMHLRYTVLRGVTGMSPIRQAMNALGVATAAEEFGAKYFAHGSRPSIILKHPGRMTPEAYKRLRSSFSENWEGLENAHRINILEDGVAPEVVGIPPEEAQFLQTREYQVQEIARLYGVPLHMLAVAQTATFASAEQDAINFRQFALLEWARRDEQRLMADLLTAGERKAGYYIEYLLDGLERATIDTRTTAYSTMIQNGVMMPNEARERENLDPHPGGDVLLLPLNMQQIGMDGRPLAAAAPVETPAPKRDEALRVLVADAERRTAARVANDVRQAGAKALRRGGRSALSEWGETQMHGWRLAGEEMLQPCVKAAQMWGERCVAPVGEWVEGAYQGAVRELIGGWDGTASDSD